MENENIMVVLEALAEKIRSLELELKLRDYDIKRLTEEKEELMRQREALCRREDENA